MNKINKKRLGAIILAAGKGKRMNSSDHNKVTLKLGNKPMVLHAVELFKKLKVDKIVVVVGFAKKSVIEILKNKVIFAEQRKRLGTGHAVFCALKILPKNIDDVLVVNGDDSAFYTKELIDKLINHHYKTDSAFTFLTIKKDDPFGLGRVIRDKNDNLVSIIEEKDANEEQKKIKEINTSCYVFKTAFLRKYISKIEKSKFTGEYYLTSLISLGQKNNEKINTLNAGNIPWRGVNTRDELIEAQKLFNSEASKQ